ncbi:hypothetical protein Tco_0499475 [Tanacetum coccineum]
MAEMFRLLKDLTISRTPKKVLVREKARNPITKCVNAISLVKMKKDKNIKNNEVVDKSIIEASELNIVELIELVGKEEYIEDGTDYDRQLWSPVLWVEIRESQWIGPELVQETTDKGGPFEILKRIGPVAYSLRLPQELSGVHDTFHVSNLKKCLVDANLHVPLGEVKIDKTLHFVEEPVEIMDRKVKKLKRSRIPIVKVRWNSKRGPEFTWERQDFMKAKYLNLVVESTS